MADIFGTSGNDYYGPNANPVGGDNFFMGDGNDFVYANTGPDSYDGGAGIDSVSYRFATAGVTLSLTNGGTGGMATGHVYTSIERIYGSNFDDIMTGGTSTDFFYGGTGNDTLSGEGGKDRIFGGEGSDILNGGADSDYIEGGLGHDTINGDNGNDRIFGDEGNDTINGGDGNDFIEGGAGGDFIDGGAGIDTVGFSTASEGVDVNLDVPPPQAEPLDSDFAMDSQGDTYINVENISGSAFDDILRGDFTANVINGNAGNDFIEGGGGNDRLTGGLGSDLLRGGEGSDLLYGDEGDDDLYGGAGNDRIYLGDGSDEAQGGEGNDFFYLTNDGSSDSVYGGINANGDGPNIDNGYDTVSYIQATAGVEILLDGLIPVEPPRPVGAEPLDEPFNMTVEQDILVGIERIIGSNFDDVIFGGSNDETIFGGNGDDLLVGGGGRDRLIGGDGADTFGFVIGGGDTDSILDFTQGVDTIIFSTFDEGLTEADVLATLTDYGTYWVFEFGLGDGFVEQRLAVIKNDPDQMLTLDDFTIELIIGSPVDEPPVQEPLAEDFSGQNFAADDMAFYDFGTLI